MPLLFSSVIASPYFVTACLGYGFGFITEKCIWACRTSRIRWIATTGVVLGGCIFAATGIAHGACHDLQNRFFFSDDGNEGNNHEMKSSKLMHTLIFLTSWTFINTFFDVLRWVMLGTIYTGSPRNKHNKTFPSSQRLALMSKISSIGKNFVAGSKCGYPALVEYRSVIDLPLAFVSIPLAATFLSLIMVPGVILLCVAHAIEPPRPCLTATKAKCLYKVYPRKFVDDQLCVVPALPDSKHPIVSLVNLVMSAAMQDGGSKKNDKKTKTATKAKESDFHHPDDDATANAESGGEAGAFALFNLVFSTMSNDYLEKRKDVFAKRHSARRREEEHDEGTASVSSLQFQLAELAQTSGTCFEDWPQMAIHECVHVRQQMLSTSVMSFLAIYLGQYGRNAFRNDNTMGMSQAYINIAAEKQAYTLESYAYATEFNRNIETVLSERENSSSATIDNVVEKHEQEMFPCWEAIKKDFYYKWY